MGAPIESCFCKKAESFRRLDEAALELDVVAAGVRAEEQGKAHRAPLPIAFLAVVLGAKGLQPYGVRAHCRADGVAKPHDMVGLGGERLPAEQLAMLAPRVVCQESTADVLPSKVRRKL